MRITLVTGVVVVAAALGLTFISMYNVQKQFMSVTLLEESFSEIQMSTSTPAIPVEGSTALGGETPATAAALVVESLPAPILSAKRTFDNISIIYLLLVCGAGMAAAYIVAGKALRPVQDLNRTIARITDQNLAERIPEDGAADEISGLTHSFNAMLNRLELSFTRQKRFSANVAHELKTPLATMNAGIQVLRLDEQPSVEDCLETLDVAQRNVKRLMNVVNDLFLLTDERKEEYSHKILINEMFVDILDELETLYAEKQLKKILDIRMGIALGNRTLVQRAFFNLVENAMKYSRDGGSITISACDGEISITNSGEGIPEEDLSRVFEPFYRVDSSRSRKTGGAGLGLSIVKTIVEKHGWAVTANCVPGTDSAMEASGVDTVMVVSGIECCFLGLK